MSNNEQDISEVVDEFVDELDPTRVEREVERLGLSTEELFDRIVVETKTRLRP